MANIIKRITLIFVLINIAAFIVEVRAGNGLERDRLNPDNIDERLARAKSLYEDGKDGLAVIEIEKQLAKDSSLILDAAKIVGGNYHLVRLTNNIFADRAGGFSPSGDKLAYARDTSIMLLDDGLFNWYEDRTTGIVYYDFNENKEIETSIVQENPIMPRFRDDRSIYFLSAITANSPVEGSYMLYRYDLEQKNSEACFALNGRGYCPYGDGVVVYDDLNSSFIYESEYGERRVIFDNDSWLSFKRPLPLILDLSSGNDVILFESGYQSGRSGKNIYGVPFAGGKPVILTTRQQSFLSDFAFCPAAVDENEFAYLWGDNRDADVYYRQDGKDYRLTFDGGIKQYLALSPDGRRLAYSYMVEEKGRQSLEVFIMDFGQDASESDLKYRFKNIK
jgi:hypothetical protein